MIRTNLLLGYTNNEGRSSFYNFINVAQTIVCRILGHIELLVNFVYDLWLILTIYDQSVGTFQFRWVNMNHLTVKKTI